ncbi:hypothetical protein MCHI_003099 [Candidatus Magnetoovum chiemensis]|nr:hypothetical protein MCHI_003099 [Candidatus Magnetoovum chiemensis]
MTPKRTRDELQNILELLAAKGISIAKGYISFEPSKKCTNISWRQTSKTLSKPQHFGTIEQYKSIIEDGSYSCILQDISILRMSYKFKDSKVNSHSLWYYPCPFKIPDDALLQEPILDLIEIYANAGTKDLLLRGHLRFDFDADFDKNESKLPSHPIAHAHIINDACRIPVKNPIPVGTFFKFIFLNFYPDIWNRFEFIKKLEEYTFQLPDKFNSKETILSEEKKLLHFSWS